MKIIKATILLISLFLCHFLAYGQSIVVGVSKITPPFSTGDTSNHYYGFCIDLMNELCKRLHETCEYKSIVVDTQMLALNSGDIDITFSPSPIVQTEMGNYIISLPYLPSIGEFVTLNPKIKTLDELKNKKIGILLESHLEDVVMGYTSKDNIKGYHRPSDLLSGLLSGDLDGALLNSTIAKYLATNKIINLHVIGKPFSLGNGYGIIALKKNAPLINKINQILVQIQNDGTYAKIYSKYFGNNSL